MFRAMFLSTALMFGAVSAQALWVSPSYVSFGQVEVGQSGFMRSVWVQNNLTEDANVTVSSGCHGEFYTSNGCFGRLPAGGSCNITLQFRPYSEGYKSCSISVYDDRGGWQNVQVNGQGVRRN